MILTGYTAVIRQDGPWWIGWIEEVPGVNSQGETRDELLANLRDALREEWIWPVIVSLAWLGCFS